MSLETNILNVVKFVLQGKNISLFIGDTILVNDSSTPATLLTTSKKKIKNIAIFLKDDDGSDEDNGGEGKSTLPDPEKFGRGKRSAVLDQKLRQVRFEFHILPHMQIVVSLVQHFYSVRIKACNSLSSFYGTPQPTSGVSSTRRS